MVYIVALNISNFSIMSVFKLLDIIFILTVSMRGREQRPGIRTMLGGLGRIMREISNNIIWPNKY